MIARGHPTSRMSSSRSSSCSVSNASCNCSRQRLTEVVIGGPIRLVESPSGGVDGAVHIGLRRVGDLTENLFGGRIDVGEGAGRAVDELAVDHHLRLEANRRGVRHRFSLSSDGELVAAGRAPNRGMTHRQADHVMEGPTAGGVDSVSSRIRASGPKAQRRNEWPCPSSAFASPAGEAFGSVREPHRESGRAGPWWRGGAAYGPAKSRQSVVPASVMMSVS